MLQTLDRTYFALFRSYPILLRLAVVTGAGQIAFALLNVYALPLYLVEGLKVSGFALGAVSTTFLLVEMFLKFPLGKLSDRYGRKPFIALGPLIVCLNPTIIASLPLRLWALIFPLRALDGVGAAALWPPLFAMVGDKVDRESRAAAMSVMNTVYVGAIGVAILLGSFMEHLTGSFKFPFYIASLLLLISGATGYFALPNVPPSKEEPRRKRDNPSAAAHEPALQARQQNSYSIYFLLLILSISLLMSMGVLSLANFLVLYLRETIKLTALQVGLLLIAMALPVVVLGLPLGHAADRWGKALAVRISLVVSAAMMWLIPHCHVVPLFALIGVVLVTSHILGTPAWLALVSEMAPASRRGSLMGMVATAEGAGAALGPLLGGWLWDIGRPLIFYGSAALLSLAAIIALAILRETKPHPDGGLVG